MPRPWLKLILFALALAVQVIAPAASGVATAYEGGGFQRDCGAVDPRRQSPTRHTNGQNHHDCALCQSFCDGAAPVPARRPDALLSPAHWVRLHWAQPVGEHPAHSRHSAHRARAPPRFA